MHRGREVRERDLSPQDHWINRDEMCACLSCGCVDGYDIKAGIRELDKRIYRVRVYEGHVSDGNFLFEGSPDE